MNTVISADGTRIAYERQGNGPPLVLVDGALCRRAFGPMAKLAELLAPHFTVVHYDRRGRDASGDTRPYSVGREVEDLAALIDALGGSAHVYGASSGAALAMRAAAAGAGVRKLVMFEPPYPMEDSGLDRELLADYRSRIDDLLAAGRRGAAVALFMKVVGVPSFGIFVMRLLPNVWPRLKAVAHTLPYDFAQLGDRPGRPLPRELVSVLGSVRVPTLLAVGGKSPAWMQRGVETVANAIPGAKLCELPGQTHNAAAEAVAPVIQEFCAG
jgi:pimeloyl-ACP methyl ester carboxylesterase